MKNLVTYHVHQSPVLPESNAIFYQYVIAQNGVFVRAENEFVAACIKVASLNGLATTIRGLQPLAGWVRLKLPKLPMTLLDTAMSEAQASVKANQLEETLSYVVWQNGRYQLIRPNDQQASPTAVVSQTVELEETVVMDMHSHGAAPPYFSPTDNLDETRLRFYGVLGNVNTSPRWLFRLGIYGYWAELSQDALFA
ncbi:MAG: Mov34/MPN/PAD-1 family protein [Ardenticatenaceae bacterium]|nr:Mov34/MPN/PAD-1 family protein [Anaerolineales bacterium]MCB9005849.1 Mov34/MPN/PAD-1 family protein [Ardenticatenaceae bacterium]